MGEPHGINSHVSLQYIPHTSTEPHPHAQTEREKREKRKKKRKREERKGRRRKEKELGSSIKIKEATIEAWKAIGKFNFHKFMYM